MKNKIILILAVALLCFIIFKITNHKKSYLLALGDSSCLASSLYGARSTSYNNYLDKHLKATLDDNYCKKNISVKELNEYIIHNNDYILNKLDKAEYITLMIGFDELTSYKEVNNIIKKEFIEDYKLLLNTIKDNTKGKIIVIGFYPNYFSKTSEINKLIEMACYNLDIIFINPENIAENSSNFFNPKYYNLNKEGNKEIFRIIREKI